MTKIKFYKASDCGHCDAMNPIIEKLKREGYDIEVIDVDKSSSRIKYIPNIQICGNGKCKRIIGEISEEKLRKML